MPYAIISKHKSCIQCLALCEASDTCISCSRTGEIVTTALTAGTFVRKIRMEIGEPTAVALWTDGTIAIAFAASNRSIIVLFDQNLTIIAQKVFDSAVTAWATLPWEDGKNYIVAAFTNRRIVICGLPGLDEVWANEQIEFEITKLAIAKKPCVIVLGTMCGKIMQLPLDIK
jgi:hypothetical protein